MEIITRQRAITEGLHRYYTGQPCKRGHYSQRYTRMSACLECLHPKSSQSSEASARREAKRQMSVWKVMLHDDDVEAFINITHALSLTREPLLTRGDIVVSDKVRRFDIQAIHSFRIYGEDLETLRQIKLSFDKARSNPLAVAKLAEVQEHNRRVLAASNVSRGGPSNITA
jgi:hypothetical protein